MRITQRGSELASLGRRACAAGIDAACVMSASGGMIGAGLLWVRVREGQAWKGMDGMEERVTRFQESLGWRRVEPVMALGSAVSRRNWQSLGMYLTHIRRQDVRTGGPVTVRSALIRHLAGWGVSRVFSRQVLQRRFKRERARMEALQNDVEEARRQHPDDEPAQYQAVAQVYRAAGVNLTSCCWMPFIPAVINAVVIFYGPRHQSPADWVAGIVTVRD
jgi:hypothetical protein